MVKLPVVDLITKFKSKSAGFLRARIADKNTQEFIRHNQRVWRRHRAREGATAEVLVELNGMHSAIIAYSYLANILAGKFQARIVAFGGTGKTNPAGLVAGLFENNNRKIFRSFNTEAFLEVSPDNRQRRVSSDLLTKIRTELKIKTDLERLEIDGILIGDLVYDTHLRRESVPTVDLGDEKFQATLKASIEKFVFWRDYFANHDVKAINISHCVYDLAIPLRIAVNLDIPVYQINATHAYRLSRENLLAYTDFKYYPEYFAGLSKPVQEAGIQEAKLRLERRFAGEVGVDMAYSSKSAFSPKKEEAVLKSSNKIKILIATHCFFDSPHPYGINLFPDFYEWLSFLGEISEKTDYDWYIKTHPDFLPGNKAIIQRFLQRYPRFSLIPADSSHRQIIDEGIDLALTVYGTIGFEYAALGVPVINASLCNPHVAYGFNLHPSSIDQYERLLLQLGDLELAIDRQQVYEYYFMKHIYNTNDWLFSSYQRMIDEVGGYRNQFTPRVYAHWIAEWTPARHAEIRSALTSFLDSGDFRLSNSHLGRDFELAERATG